MRMPQGNIELVALLIRMVKWPKLCHDVPGHVDLLPNEIADLTAKTAAKEAINAGEGSVDLQLIKKTVRKVAVKKWNRSWRNTSS